MGTASRVHLWGVSLDASPDAFAGYLKADELDRANRFHIAEHRTRYIVRRGKLRCILSEFLNQFPQEIEFDYGPFGKPALRDRGTPHFNVSHRENRALIAICEYDPVGVDIESARRLEHCEELSAIVFNDRERQQMNALPEGSRTQSFFRGWTRKEAYLKAIGAGLSGELHDVTVDLRAEFPLLLEVKGDDAGRWSMRNVPAPEGFLGAVAIRCREPEVIWHGEMAESAA
jgi:4'-phosphopantetheinyl transferase